MDLCDVGRPGKSMRAIRKAQRVLEALASPFAGVHWALHEPLDEIHGPAEL